MYGETRKAWDSSPRSRGSGRTLKRASVRPRATSLAEFRNHFNPFFVTPNRPQSRRPALVGAWKGS